MTGEKAHSKYGASSSHRWWHCAASVQACEGLPNISSSFAVEGQCAHAVAETCLNNGQDAASMIDRTIKEFPDNDIDEEMTDAVQVYLDCVRGDMAKYPDAELAVEVKFDLTHIYPDMFGTNDASIYIPSLAKLIVYDYKHGRGVPVEVPENPQMLYYATGALTGKNNRPIATVEIVVVQPRCPHSDGPIRRWETDPLFMMDWIADLKDAVMRTKVAKPIFMVGEWCKFCPKAPTCPELSKAVYEAAKADFADDSTVIVSDPQTYSLDALGQALTHANVIENWVRSVRAFAHMEAEAGRIVPGYKLVPKRAYRKHKSEERTFDALLDYGVGKAAITNPGKLMSPAQLEAHMKKLGVKPAELAELFFTPDNGATLAPVADKRESVKPEAASEFMES